LAVDAARRGGKEPTAGQDRAGLLSTVCQLTGPVYTSTTQVSSAYEPHNNQKFLPPYGFPDGWFTQKPPDWTQPFQLNASRFILARCRRGRSTPDGGQDVFFVISSWGHYNSFRMKLEIDPASPTTS
jgi:hypothetical protein